MGQHSLWAHHIWNASKVLADYFDTHHELVKGKKVLELGAGGALPSFIAACNGADKVLTLGDVTDSGGYYRLSWYGVGREHAIQCFKLRH